MTLRSLMNKTALPALLIAGLVGIAAAAPASATVWGASDADPAALNRVSDYERGLAAANAQPIDSGLPGFASGASDADPTAGNRNLAVNTISGAATPRHPRIMPQLTRNSTGSAEVGVY